MIEHPYYPIVYVRGYAGSQGGVEETAATPYMGFNTGSTKLRQAWDGSVARHIFESPLIRLGKDHDYIDMYEDGDVIPKGERISPRSVWIFRYYDQVSKEMPDEEGERPEIETYAEQLGEFIDRIRDHVCGGADDPDPEVAKDRERFRVYLVAHSMGGLIVRCYLQNIVPTKGIDPNPVDKAFTYGTPHRGIDMKVVGNLASFFPINNNDNFKRGRMREYLQLSEEKVDINSLDEKFPKDRFFSIVGTNHRDYGAAKGLSRIAVGSMSDGLVRIENAAVAGGPRAYVHRSHSGHYGMVNSEDGYQNLRRFLFGDARVDLLLDVDGITLPPDIWEAANKGKKIEASYHFEVITRVRGTRWDLHRRTVGEESARFVTHARIQKVEPITLASTFLLDSARVAAGSALGFSLDVGLLAPNYSVNKVLWMKDYYEGGYVFREKFNFEFTIGDPPVVRWGRDSDAANLAEGEPLIPVPGEDGVVEFHIPIDDESHPKLTGTLIIRSIPWNDGPWNAAP